MIFKNERFYIESMEKFSFLKMMKICYAEQKKVNI